MARILYLTQIDIDAGAVRLLAGECQRTGMRKPLVVPASRSTAWHEAGRTSNAPRGMAATARHAGT